MPPRGRLPRACLRSAWRLVLSRADNTWGLCPTWRAPFRGGGGGSATGDLITDVSHEPGGNDTQRSRLQTVPKGPQRFWVRPQREGPVMKEVADCSDPQNLSRVRL